MKASFTISYDHVSGDWLWTASATSDEDIRSMRGKSPTHAKARTACLEALTALTNDNVEVF